MSTMQHRIRSAALIVNGNSILLVRHRHPRTGFEWWVPPGGGVEGSESIFDCARREVFEESGISVELGDIVYIREFIELEVPVHHAEFFIWAKSYQGNVSIENLVEGDVDAHVIQEARFVPRAAMDGLTVYPEILRDGFWDDLRAGFHMPRYLGVQRQSPDAFTPK